MSIYIEDVNDSNMCAVTGLSVAKGQEHCIEGVKACLEEAKGSSVWNPVAIYSCEAGLIGFAMYGFFEDEDTDGRLWLDRFFIDRNHQGKGFAKPCIRFLEGHLRKQYPFADRLYLSVYEDNVNAIRIYSSLGFRFNRELDVNGELVMVKKL